jgi:hypothetical protein
MKLATPYCPLCHRRTVDEGDHFACARTWGCRPSLPSPAEWYREAAGELGLLAAEWMQPNDRGHASPFFAYVEARAAASCALRACPELRQ